MPRRELKKKPLVEAILELKWALPQQPNVPLPADPHYRLLLGRFSERIQDTYPFHEPLPTSQVPDAMVVQMVQHRFRTREGGWPLIQIGPGIMTVNETDGYNWEDFKDRCVHAVSNLVASHPARNDFAVQDLMLRYIDAVDVNFSEESILEFLREKMKTEISLPASLFNGGPVRSNPTLFNWQVAFPIEDNKGLIMLRFAMGARNNRPALVWELSVQAVPLHIPQIPDGFPTWLTNAHELTDDWFFKLIEGQLEESFSGE